MNKWRWLLIILIVFALSGCGESGIVKRVEERGGKIMMRLDPNRADAYWTDWVRGCQAGDWYQKDEAKIDCDNSGS